MPRKNNDLKDRLARYRQIKLSVIGRRSGKALRHDHIASSGKGVADYDPHGELRFP
jgi:hypothetical protein